MKNESFEKYKIKREIEMHGEKYDVFREEKDQRNESTGKQKKITTLCGLFHVSKGYITDIIADGVHVHSKGHPMLLCMIEDIENINDGDLIEIGNVFYKVIEKNNIQLFDVAVDMSLEVVLNERDPY